MTSEFEAQFINVQTFANLLQLASTLNWPVCSVCLSGVFIQRMSGQCVSGLYSATSDFQTRRATLRVVHKERDASKEPMKLERLPKIKKAITKKIAIRMLTAQPAIK